MFERTHHTARCLAPPFQHLRQFGLAWFVCGNLNKTFHVVFQSTTLAILKLAYCLEF